MNGRSLTLANAKEIREQIHYWERRVAAFAAGSTGSAALADFRDG